MEEELRIRLENAKNKKAMSPEKRIPEWILNCNCRSCKRLRKILAIEAKKIG